MHKRDGLSATHEMYLKIIYQLQAAGDPARVGQMAKGLGVHPSTVSAVVRTLDRTGLVTHDRYGVVKLTDVGQRLAECVVRRFEILQRFYVEVLGVDEDNAALEACELEHAVSPEAVARLEWLLSRIGEIGLQPPETISLERAAICSDCLAAGECTAVQAANLDQ